LSGISSTSDAAATVWLDILHAFDEDGHISRVLLGGSRGCGEDLAESDTDLFVEVAKVHPYGLTRDFRIHLQCHRPDLLVSTVSFRADFGFRVRAAKDGTHCCSYFFFMTDDVRQTRHWRKGRPLWASPDSTPWSAQLHRKPHADLDSRDEELIDALLEVPSILKYLRRGDAISGEIRITKAIVGLINYLTLDPTDYEAGTTKWLEQRLSGYETSTNSFVGHLCAGQDLNQRGVLLLRLMRVMESGISPEVARYCRDACERLNALL
jgi:hypothetical protein